MRDPLFPRFGLRLDFDNKIEQYDRFDQLCPELLELDVRELGLRYCSFTEVFYDHAAQSPTALRLCETISFVCCHEPPMSFFELLPSRFENLTYLSFSSTVLSEDCGDFIIGALPGLPNLEEFILARCMMVVGDGDGYQDASATFLFAVKFVSAANEVVLTKLKKLLFAEEGMTSMEAEQDQLDAIISDAIEAGFLPCLESVTIDNDA